MPPDDPIASLPARELSRRIHAREVSCREVMDAHLARIGALNPVHNAIVSLRPADALLAEADGADAALARGQDRGRLHGFPLAVKDLVDTAGVRRRGAPRCSTGCRTATPCWPRGCGAPGRS